MENVIENNALIAQFMGYEGQHEEWCGNNVLDINGLGFEEMRPYNPHSNWSDLMPVIEKIEDYGASTFQIFGTSAKYKPQYDIELLNHGETKIEAVYKTVIEFINWYNLEAPQPNL